MVRNLSPPSLRKQRPREIQWISQGHIAESEGDSISDSKTGFHSIIPYSHQLTSQQFLGIPIFFLFIKIKLWCWEPLICTKEYREGYTGGNEVGQVGQISCGSAHRSHSQGGYVCKALGVLKIASYFPVGHPNVIAKKQILYVFMWLGNQIDPGYYGSSVLI